jgi:Nucleosome assembly protein (NAP)
LEIGLIGDQGNVLPGPPEVRKRKLVGNGAHSPIDTRFRTGTHYSNEDDDPASFFDFFSPPTALTEENEEEKDELEFRLEMDFNLGEQFKDDLIPRAVEWYTGDAAEDDEDVDYEEYENSEDEDEDEEDKEDLYDGEDLGDEEDSAQRRWRQVPRWRR